jgi:DNA-binding SARP family transcriptional activator/TolB-like protein/Tfp pilus assembly protein PilF
MSSSAQRLSGVAAPSAEAGEVAVRLRLIGHMEAVTPTNESVLPAGRKTRALLAVIALSSPRPALRGRLAELLWSRRPEEQARASLRQEIHRLLEYLACTESDILLVTRDHLSLRPGTVWIDVEEVMRATAAAPAALSLLDGDLLEDLSGIDPAFDAWLVTERERLCDRARTVAEALLREQAEPEAAILAAQQLLAIDRAHEGAWRALMRAHAERGERGMAIQAYDRCRAALADLLDAAPSLDTQRLLVEIRGPAHGRLPARPTAPLVQLHPPPPVEMDDVTLAADSAGGSPIPEPPDDRIGLRAARAGACVGVLPFRLVGTADAEVHFAHGLAEEITAALSRCRWLFVVSSSSLTRSGQEGGDEGAIRRALGVDFLLDGMVQRDRERLRVTLRLLDVRAGDQVVWARRFDREGDDLLSLQDEIASEVAAQIDPEILLIEARRVAGQPLADASAYELVLCALLPMTRLERGPFMQAGQQLERAIQLEPDYAPALAWYAFWHLLMVGQGWADDSKNGARKAGELAERAIMFDPHDARALTIAGHVRAYLYHRPREAAALHERALSLNPNLAMAWALSAATHAYLGDIDEAERCHARYRNLLPLDPYGFMFDGFAALIHLLKRDHQAAVVAGRAVTQVAPLISTGFKPYLSALGHLGCPQEANTVRRKLLAIEPGFNVALFLRTSALERPGDRQHFAEGLRLAGIPETAA